MKLRCGLHKFFCADEAASWVSAIIDYELLDGRVLHDLIILIHGFKVICNLTCSPPSSKFECKICIEEARHPVVTRCGHLYW